jgi:hypothetical protein
VLVDLLEDDLDSRAVCFPTAGKRASCRAKGAAAWPPTKPLFVGSDGERITLGTLQGRPLMAISPPVGSGAVGFWSDRPVDRIRDPQATTTSDVESIAAKVPSCWTLPVAGDARRGVPATRRGR